MTAYDFTGEDFWFQRSDVDTLRKLALMLPERPVVVNIGAGYGTSALTVVEARADAFVFSVDTDVWEAEANALTAAGLYDQHRVVRVLGRSQDAGRHWPALVDMVFVDGDNSAAGVRGDAHTWLPRIKPGGIIAFHDYGTPSLPGVKEAVDIVMRGYERLVHVKTLIAFRVPE